MTKSSEVKKTKSSRKVEPKTEEPLDKLKALFDVVERAKDFWESTFDSIVNPVMIVDTTYQIQRANWAMARVIGKDVRELIGETCYQVFGGHDRPCRGCPLTETWKTHQSSSSRVEKCADGREYQGVSFPLKGKKQELDLYIVQYRDVREERQLQARLIQSEKMAAVGLLAGGIAHEINNPLSGILAFAQLAMTQTQKGSQLMEDIKEIEASALRCKKIVENLLEFSRHTSPEERQEIDLKEVLERVLPLLKVQVKEAGVYLETDYSDSSFKMIANANQLEQVFLNLTSNACHALPRGGKIQISVSRPEADWVRVDFADNGSGIKKEHLPQIFDPFFTTKKTGKGTGLGLSITYSIIQDHGGRVEVNSTEGNGTTFRINLPVNKEGMVA